MARRRREIAVGFLLSSYFLYADLPGAPKDYTSGPALDIEAWNGGICSCFSATPWTKVDAESRKTSCCAFWSLPPTYFVFKFVLKQVQKNSLWRLC